MFVIFGPSCFLPENILIGGFLSTAVLKLDVLMRFLPSFLKKLLYFEESLEMSSVNCFVLKSSSSP